MIIKETKAKDDIYADLAKEFSAPKLEEADYIYEQSAKTFFIPKLKREDNLSSKQ